MKNFLILIFLGIVGIIQPNISFAKSTEFSAYSEIPDPLVKKLNSRKYLEDYIKDVLLVIRMHAADKKNLTEEDAQKYVTQKKKKFGEQQIKRLLKYDYNNDGQIDLNTEVFEQFKKDAEKAANITHTSSSIEKQALRSVELLAKHDLNNDGIISYKEMGTVEDINTFAPQYAVRHDNAEDFLKIDPNGDRVLTLDELKTLATKAFNTVDLDKDGYFSPEEGSHFQPYKASITMGGFKKPKVQAGCQLPFIPSRTKVAFIGATWGKNIPNLTIAGQERQTNLIHVQIDSEKEDLYLVLGSYGSIVWKLDGNVERVKKVVVLGPSHKDDPKNLSYGSKHVNSAVVGVHKDIVTFNQTQKCGIKSYNTSGDKKKVLSRAVNLLERTPDYFFVKSFATGFRIFDGRVNTDIAEGLHAAQIETPEGFDSTYWKKHIQYTPGGYIELNPEDLVTYVEVEEYEVLPKWAGIAKLVHDKALIPVIHGNPLQPGSNMKEHVNTFLISKEMPYYPAGMYNEQAVNFIVGRGIKPPQGDPGHSVTSMQ